MKRARTAKGRFVKRSRAASHHRSTAPAVVNRRRKRSYSHNPRTAKRRSGRVVVINPRHRRYRHNPGFSLAGLGLERGTVNTLLYTGGGMVGTPYLESLLIKGVLPVTITATPLGRYAVKIGSAFALGLVANKVLGREPAKQVLIGGLLYVLVGALQEFLPTYFAAPAVTLKGMGRYIGTRAQPLLAGGVRTGLGAYQRNYMGNITSQTPGRLQPQSSY